MKKKSVYVRILEATEKTIKVMLPFIDIPIEMNRTFFNKRVESGYFKLNNDLNTSSKQ